MSVLFGSARGSYGNTARGDQSSGKEVSTQSMYTHSKGWRVFVAKDPVKREMIAFAMERACANNKIGYSQLDRLALYNQVKTKDFDPGKATEITNCDCSSLVRVCCWYAGIKVTNFTTVDEPSALLKTGEFIEVPWKGVDYVGRGYILDTKTKGHTGVVLGNGSKWKEPVSGAETVKTEITEERILRNGTSGADVKEMQGMLIQLGYDLGKWGADGDFGDATEMAVKAFQSDSGIKVDGICGTETMSALWARFTDHAETGTVVGIIGGNCYVRTAPNISGDVIGVAYTGTRHIYANETSTDGWYKIVFTGTTGWVSGKYAERM